MDSKLSFFESTFLEAPGDEVADAPPDVTATTDGPPDVTPTPDDAPPTTDPIPDPNDPPPDDGPPDIGDAGIDNFTADTPDDPTQQNTQPIEIDEKISTVMNANLYTQFITLLSSISNQLSMVSNNNDMIYSTSPDSLNIIERLKKLQENVNSYLAYKFIDTNYSQNQLFYTKCINLLNLVDIDFGKTLKREKSSTK